MAYTGKPSSFSPMAGPPTTSFGMATKDLTMEQRLAGIHKTQGRLAEIMDDTRMWENKCEERFAEFRRAVVHLKRDQEALDAVEDKEMLWRFICRICKSRTTLRDRSKEVLEILTMSDAWMKVLKELDEKDDEDAKVEDLPEAYQDKFKPKDDHKDDSPPADDSKKDGKGVDGKQAPSGPPAGSVMSVLVQPFSSAKLSVDGTESPSEIGQGLHMAVAFGPGAKEERVAKVGRSLLRAKLIKGDAGVQSLSTACGKGAKLTLIVLPEKCLGAELDDKDDEIKYSLVCKEDSRFEELFKVFVEAMRTKLKEEPEKPKEDDAEKAKEAYRAELTPKKNSELKAIAKAAGCTEEEIDHALDEKDVQAAMIDLLIRKKPTAVETAAKTAELQGPKTSSIDIQCPDEKQRQQLTLTTEGFVHVFRI